MNENGTPPESASRGFFGQWRLSLFQALYQAVGALVESSDFVGGSCKLARPSFFGKGHDPFKVASNFYPIPGVTAILGWLILRESLTTVALLGFLVASLGVWLAHRE